MANQFTVVADRWVPIFRRAWTEELGRLFAEERVRRRLIAGGVLIGLAWVVFHCLGAAYDVRHFGRSIFTYLARRYHEFPEEQHGPIAPLVTIGLLWHMRRELVALPRRVALAATPLVALSLLLHWVGVRGQFPRLSLAAFVLFLWSAVLLLWGWRVAWKAAFPIAFLVFAMPLSFLNDYVAFPLRMFITPVAAGFARLCGIDVINVGTQLFNSTKTFSYDVAPACSGIRSLLALTMITGAYGFVTQPTLIGKILLLLSAMPLAVLGNLARITMVIFAGAWFGQDAGKVVHDWGWIVTWLVAISAMLWFGSVLMVPVRSRVERWTDG